MELSRLLLGLLLVVDITLHMEQQGVHGKERRVHALSFPPSSRPLPLSP